MKKISVAITTYNRSSELKRAIESVLNQDYERIEVVVLDDCSPDDTEQMVSKIDDERVIYYRNTKNLGPRRNIRKIIDYCTGDLIIFLNDDDYYTDNHFFSDAISRMINNVKMYCASALVYDAYKQVTNSCEIFMEGILTGVEYIRGYLTKYEKPVSTFTSVLSLDDFKKSCFMSLNELDDNLILLIGFSFGDVYMSRKNVGTYRYGDNSVSATLGEEFIKNNIEGLSFLYEEFNRQGILSSSDWLRQQILILSSFVVSVHNTTFQNILYMFGKINNLEFKGKTSLYIKILENYIASKLRGQ
ncbi:MAG: glycosyltransferase family 2 protein [Erysipelotrichales bacterium]|nr:glycosyltransferase family 2 protein [Erysipelotrichales bacterium]